MGKNFKESGYKLGKDVSGRAGGRDYAVFPVKERRFLHSKQTGFFVEVTRAEPGVKRGLFGGVVYTAAVRAGRPDITGPNLRKRDSDPKLGTDKARRATRAGRRLGESWLDKTSNSKIRELIEASKPQIYGGRK